MSALTDTVEAERQVIGSMLTYEPALSKVLEGSSLTGQDFYPGLGIVFDQIAALHGRGEPVDPITVSAALTKAGKLEAAGGEKAIFGLAEGVSAPGNAAHHARIVLEGSLRRLEIAVAGDIGSGKITAKDGAAKLAAIEARRFATTQDGFKSTSFAQVRREKVKFLWKDRIPVGMMTLLMGDPGLGKSMFTTYLAGPISRAGAGVLLFTGEDDPAATIRPRLEAAGADLENVHTATKRHDGMDDGITLPDDGPEIQKLVQTAGIKLIVVDPLMAFLPATVNSWNDQSVRRALAPLYAIARDERCAVLIVAHLNKAKQGNALHRAGGSIGIPAAVRSALLLARDPGDPDGERGNQRVLAHVKCNVGPQRESLSCEIVTATLDDGSEVPKLELTGVSEATAAELLDAPDASEAPERDEAEQFLLTELAEGPQLARSMKARARDQMISDTTLKRAKKAVGVISEKLPDGAWQWKLDQGGHPLKSGQGGHEGQGGQPYMSNVTPLTPQAKNKDIQSEIEGQGGHGSDIAVALLKSEFDAVEVSA